MRKIAWLIVIACAHGAVFSFSMESGILASMQSIAMDLQTRNRAIQLKYATAIRPLIEKIQETTQENEKLMREIRALEQDKALLEKEYLFYKKQETELLRLQAGS